MKIVSKVVSKIISKVVLIIALIIVFKIVLNQSENAATVIKISKIVIQINNVFLFCKNGAFYIYFEIKVRNHSIIFKKKFKFLKLIENKSVVIARILFSKINTFNKSIRCLKIINEEYKKNLFDNKKGRFFSK